MKYLPIVLISLSVAAAGCGSSTPTSNSNPNQIKFTATLLPSNETPAVTNAESSGNGNVAITMPRVRQDVHERRAQTFCVGDDRCECRVWLELHLDWRGVCRFAARGILRVGAHGVQIRRCIVEPNWPGKVQHIVHHAIQARDLLVDVGQRLSDFGTAHLIFAEGSQRRFDDHQRVANFVRNDRRETSER